jgi:hypothetical protein
MGVMQDISFFDKVIHVTFYRWITYIEDGRSLQSLAKAFTIRSDQPGPGFNYFAPVSPPSYDRVGGEPALTGKEEGVGYNDNFTGFIGHSGPKPAMRLQLTQLPETVCTNVILSIENLTLELDITEYSAMYIEAGYGYSNGSVQLVSRFYAGIFSSYIESPNPNGRTTFTGIVGNWFVKGLRAQPYRLLVAEKVNITLRNFVEIICSYLGATPIFEGMGDYLLEQNIPEISREKLSMRAQSGYQVLDWLAKMVGSLSAGWRASRIIDPTEVIGTYFYDNKLFISLMHLGNPKDKEKIAVNLSRISSATFNGGTLYITAPWNPLLVPGSLFYMESVFFRGRMAPTAILPTISDRAALYRPITIEIVFDTVGGSNHMRILATAAKLLDWSANEENAKDGQVISQEDGAPFTPTIYNSATGEYEPITIANAIKAERENAARMAYGEGQEGGPNKGTMAAFYADGTDPYAIGILEGALKGGDSPQDKELTRRWSVDTIENAITSNQDIIIDLSAESMAAWESLTGRSLSKRQNEAAAAQSKLDDNAADTFVGLKDPAREGSFYNLASGGIKIEIAKEGCWFGAREITKLMNKLQGEKGVWSVMQYPIVDTHIDLIPLLRAISAAMSYKEYITEVEKHTDATERRAYREIWKGNNICFIPYMEGALTNINVANNYPRCDNQSNIQYLYAPSVKSSSDLTKLLDTWKDYIHAVIDYGTKLSESKGETSPGKDVQALTLLMNKYELYGSASRPWWGFDKYGKGIW